jgi:hypothetical protein
MDRQRRLQAGVWFTIRPYRARSVGTYLTMANHRRGPLPLPRAWRAVLVLPAAWLIAPALPTGRTRSARSAV